MTPQPRRLRHRLSTVVSAAVLVAGAIVFVVSAVFAHGFPVRQVDLNDGGVWVTSDHDGLFGRLNRPAGSLDAVFYPPGGAQSAYTLDVLQAGSAAVAWDRGAGKLFAVDTTRGVAIGSDGLATPSGLQLRLAGGTLAALDPSSGKVWAVRLNMGKSLAGLDGLDFTGTPLTTVDVGGAAEGQTRAALAVGLDGSIYVAATTGHTAVIRPNGTTFGRAAAGDLGRTLTAVQVTAVGERMVVLDPSTGDLLGPDFAPVKLTLPGDPADLDRVALQWPGPAGPAVLVATSAGLLALSGGQVSSLFQEFSGTPTAPMRMAECIYAAWAGGTGGYARGCDGARVAKGSLENSQVLVQPVFRTNRGVVVLNDLRNGAAWDLLEQQRMDNWTQVKPPPKQDPAKDRHTSTDPQVLRDQPPKAVDDTLGARPGRTTLLHVLDNDSDPAGSILSISAVTAADVASAKVSIAPDGQTVAVTITQPGGAVHFKYTVDDGRNSAQATVTVEVRTAAQNEAPRLRTGFKAPKWSVLAGNRLPMPVLADWRDYDGDPLALASARATAGSAITRTDGFLDYLAPAEGGRTRISYEVSDGITKPTASEVDVTVLARDAAAKVAPVALPDVVRGQAGQPIVVHPLDNDIPGSDPANPLAKLALAGDVTGAPGAVVVTNLATGTVVVTASKPGPYELHYTAAFGNAAFDKGGLIRVDVVPAPKSPLPPVAMPDTAVLHGQLPSTVDVLANDFDPAGGVLAILNAQPASATAKLQVAIVDGRWLRINAMDAPSSGTAQMVRYTISNGYAAPVTGEVSVTRLPDTTDTQPVPVDDFATVRSGEAVTVAVLDNDTNAAGAPMMLAANVADAPGPGQLVASAPGVTEAGTAYVTGNLVRYVAPTVTTALPVRVDYVVQNAAGDQAVGHVKVTVTPLPSAKNPNRPPAPAPVEIRAVSGQTVTISIPTAGVDADGDPVMVSGIASAPPLGRILATNATSISYQAFPTSVGTDSFIYLVTDRFGGIGRASVRVGITTPGSPQPPVAVDDVITASPGAKVHADVLANDLRTPGDVVSILPLQQRNAQLPEGTKLTGAFGPIDVTAPDLTGKPVVVVYSITDGIGEPSIATVTVRSQKDYNNPPIAYDAYADPQPGAKTVDVDVLAHCADPDGEVGDLEITRVFDPQATVSGGRVTLPVLDTPRTVAYEVRDADGATAVGLIHVSTPGYGTPYLKPGANLTIGKNAKSTVDIADYVVSPSGRNLRLTTTDRIWASPPKSLTAANKGEATIDLTSVGDYVGPAALVFEVTDGANLSDPEGRTAVISIPVQVGPETPVLHCPQDPITVIEGGPTVTVNVTTVCHVWVARPEQLTALKYDASWKQKASGIDLGGEGQSVTLTAASGTAPGTTGRIAVGVTGSAAVPGVLDVTVVPAAPASFAPVVVDGIKEGGQTTIDVAGYIRSVLRDPKLSVVGVAQTSGMKATVSFEGTRVTLAPSVPSHGEMKFAVTATDVADAARGDRHVTGQITLHVLGAPDAPGTPASGVEVLSHTANLHWTAPANNGAPIDYYEVAWANGKQQCPGSPCMITGLKNNVPYTFTVRAHNLAGWSKPSGASVPIRPDQAPGPVTGLAAANPQDHALTLTWAAVNVDGSPVQRYEISWSGGGSARVAGTTYTPSTLDNDVVYTFTVIAVNAKGPGPGAQVTGQSAGAPARPSAPSFTSLNSVDSNTRAVNVSWNAVGPNGPGPTSYTLTRSGNGTVTVCAEVTATSCPDDGIANNGVTYTYTLTAANAVGGAAHTSPASPGTTMVATATPDPIVQYAIAATGVDGQARLTFDVPPSHGSSSTVKCSWSGGSCGSWTYPVDGQSGAVRTIGGLNNGQATAVSLQVCNGSSGGAGAGTPCNTAVARNVTTYGDMNSLTVNASASGSSVNFTVSVNPNGKPASVRVQSAGRDQTFTTGVGTWSQGFTDNVGWSTTDNITVTVSDSGRPTLTKTASATTPPPPPTVTVTAGAACGPGVGTTCAGDPGGGCNSTCHYITVTTANFSGNQTCSFNSSLGSGGYVTMTIGPNQTKQSGNWYGVHGGWAEATCGGVTGRSGPWP